MYAALNMKGGGKRCPGEHEARHMRELVDEAMELLRRLAEEEFRRAPCAMRRRKDGHGYETEHQGEAEQCQRRITLESW